MRAIPAWVDAADDTERHQSVACASSKSGSLHPSVAAIALVSTKSRPQ